MSRKIKSPIRQQRATVEVGIQESKSLHDLINEAVQKMTEQARSAKWEYREPRLLCINGIIVSEDAAINLLS